MFVDLIVLKVVFCLLFFVFYFIFFTVFFYPFFVVFFFLNACLQSVVSSHVGVSYELIVVDDGSDDDSAEIAHNYTSKVIILSQTGGPAAARNHAARQAKGTWLFFTDADCKLHRETLARAAHLLKTHPHLDALIGSYDDQPEAPNFISQYKNLLHHYTHQTSPPEATTFWTGCGAIRRHRFLALGGFNSQRYPQPSIEDIELGYRLIAAGGHIRLEKTLQLTHLKHWTFLSMLKSDILQRALPWSRLLQTEATLPAQLNLRLSHRLSAVILLGSLIGAMVPAPTTPIFRKKAQQLRYISTLTYLSLNAPLYRFLAKKRDLKFLFCAIPLHALYYLYGVLTFIYTHLTPLKKSK